MWSLLPMSGFHLGHLVERNIQEICVGYTRCYICGREKNIELWRIELLGGLRTIKAGHITDYNGNRKAESLLAQLAYFAPQAQSREVLIERLWPDSDAEVVRNRLRVLLAEVRRLLEPFGTPPGTFLEAERAAVRLRPGTFSTDVAEFQSALRQSGMPNSAHETFLRRAMALYRGPFLPQFYDEWITLPQRRLEDEWAAALLQLTRLLRDKGDARSAIEFARQGVTLEPLREDFNRDLMTCYAAAGQPELALRQFQSFERLLRTQIGTTPAATTLALRQSIEAERHTAPLALPHSPSSLPASAPLPKGSLPFYWTNFFGRVEEIAAIRYEVRDKKTRLLCLTGVPGCGKTRLAIEAAQTLRSERAIYFVPLSGVSDAAFLPQTILNALREPHEAAPLPVVKTDLAPQIAALLGSQAALLVLDNFEHLVEGGAPFLETLLACALPLCLLVTSRRRLGLASEHETPVEPLPTPPPAALQSEIAGYASVQLFLERARAAWPSVALNERNAAAVSALCARLEGLPLAIELAAARADVLSPTQMLARLQKRLDFLQVRHNASVAPDDEVRHRTLRGAIEWSYALLPDEQQKFFARLWVFRGGWNEEACCAVCEEPRALHFLSQLRAASFVQGATPQDTMRFSLLETLREFAGEQLNEAEKHALQARHAAFYRAVATEGDVALADSHSADWLWNLEPERDNFRAAMDWTLKHEPHNALQTASAFSRFWYLRGNFSEGLEWLERALRQTENNPAIRAIWRAWALTARGNLATLSGDLVGCREELESAIVTFRTENDEHHLADALSTLGLVLSFQGEAQAAQSARQEALLLARKTGDIRLILRLLETLGMLAGTQGQMELALTLFRERVEVCRQIGDKFSILASLISLGQVLYELGDERGAQAHLDEALPLALEFQSPWEVSRVYWVLGNVARLRGEWGGAAQNYHQSFETFRQVRNPMALHILLLDSAFLQIERGQFQDAALLLGAAQSVVEKGEIPPFMLYAARCQAARENLQAQLGDTLFQQIWNQGHALPLDAALERALQII